MRVFITGACGFIGSHLAEALAREGHDVTAMALYDARGSYGWLDDCEGMEKVHGDVRDAEQIRGIIFDQAPDVVFHLAAQIDVAHSYKAPRSFVETNVVGTLNVLEACRYIVTKLIHTSSSEVYGSAIFTPQTVEHPLQAQSPYAATKIAADKLVESYHRTYGLNAVIVRPFNTYGPRQSERAVIPRIIRQALAPEREGIALGNVKPKRDFTYVTDTVRGFIAAMNQPFGVYQIGTGKNISIAELVPMITDKPIFKEGPKRPESSEVDELLCGDSIIKPDVSLDEGLERTIAWWRGP